MVNYTKDLLQAFAKRTDRNLSYVEAGSKIVSMRPPVYEITQLVNSSLGLLFFPKEKFYDSLPTWSFKEMKRRGWPLPTLLIGKVDDNRANFKEVIRLLRNSLAHSHIRFLDKGNNITGLLLWNVSDSGSVNWAAYISVRDLRMIFKKFYRFLDKDLHKEKRDFRVDVPATVRDAASHKGISL